MFLKKLARRNEIKKYKKAQIGTLYCAEEGIDDLRLF